MKNTVSAYTFVAASKTVTLTDWTTVQLERLFLIVNVTDQIIIYNPADTAAGATAATNVFTLEYDTTSMSNSDDLLILYDSDLGDPTYTAAQPISAASLPLPSGAATSAKQDTGNASLASLVTQTDGIEASLSSIDGKNPALGQALAAASVPVVLTAAQITTLTPPAAITGYATSALQTQPGVDIGDVTINNSTGASAVNIQDGGNSVTVDNGGTFVVQENGAALTALQLIDDVVSVLGTATYTEAATKGAVIGAVRRDANTTLVDTTNEIAPLQVNATGELKVAQIQSLPAGTNAIGKLAANSGVDIGDVDILSIAAGDNNIGNVDIVTMPTVTVNAHAVTNAGTFVTQENGALLTSAQLIDDAIFTAGTSTYTEATSKGELILAVRRDADTTLVDTTNEMTPLQVNAGGQLKVAVIAALPAGTAAIGKLAANSGVDIGDVDITSVTPGTAAGNLGKAEDAGHTTGDTGVMALAVRNDTPTAISGTDLDYTPIAVDQYGILRVTPLSVTYVLTRTSDTNVYASGDCIASAVSSPTVPTASGFGRNNAGSGRIERVVIRVSTLPATPYNLELIIHKSVHTQGNDNAAVALSDADNATIIADVQLGGAPITLGANCLYQAEVDIPYVCGAGTTALWFELVCRSATTPGSADQFSIEFLGLQFN